MSDVYRQAHRKLVASLMLQQPLSVKDWVSPKHDGKGKVPNVLLGYESGDGYVSRQ
jgi:hypothetical protein